jgi:hypothetical protein
MRRRLGRRSKEGERRGVKSERARTVQSCKDEMPTVLYSFRVEMLSRPRMLSICIPYLTYSTLLCLIIPALLCSDTMLSAAFSHHRVTRLHASSSNATSLASDTTALLDTLPRPPLITKTT